LGAEPYHSGQAKFLTSEQFLISCCLLVVLLLRVKKWSLAITFWCVLCKLKLFGWMSDTHSKVQDGNNYKHWKILDLVLDLNYFSISNPNLNPKHLPKHITLSLNYQFCLHVWYVEYYYVHEHMAWGKKFRLTPRLALRCFPTSMSSEH